MRSTDTEFERRVDTLSGNHAYLFPTKLRISYRSLWLTPVYTYVGHWIWGGWLCYGLPLFQGTSIFISTLTLMAIAIDRYFVIVHHSSSSANVNDHMSMPFLVPFVIIGFSYIQIWNFLNSRNSMVSQRESEYENARKKRLLRMLIIMVVVFGICWFPFNLLNILRDLHLDSFIKPYFSFLFLSAHVISMTATCWNPIVYAWMNEAFRERFIAAVPFLSRWFVSGRRNRPRVLADCDAVSERPKLCSTSGKGPSDAVLKPLIEHKSNAAGWNENACCSKWNRPSLHFYNGGPRFLENAKNSNDNKCLCTDETAHGFGLTSKVEPNVTECEINCERQKPCPKHNSSSSLNELHSAHMPCTRFLSLDPHNRSTALLSSRSTQRRRIANDQRALFEMKTCIV
ncbi:Neuropeptide Y receptor type 6 [Toxocara canis]|uniref:Neuropeptide Y receptor type 6 n=1 Tax=Toxocara canis TaxID=6265 RepID=A0A0B2VGN5_TOXCA|nr:Neuropeptide Y receptor type 6 [Toxocara canis]